MVSRYTVRCSACTKNSSRRKHGPRLSLTAVMVVAVLHMDARYISQSHVGLDQAAVAMEDEDDRDEEERKSCVTLGKNINEIWLFFS